MLTVQSFRSPIVHTLLFRNVGTLCFGVLLPSSGCCSSCNAGSQRFFGYFWKAVNCIQNFPCLCDICERTKKSYMVFMPHAKKSQLDKEYLFQFFAICSWILFASLYSLDSVFFFFFHFFCFSRMKLRWCSGSCIEKVFWGVYAVMFFKNMLWYLLHPDFSVHILW